MSTSTAAKLLLPKGIGNFDEINDSDFLIYFEDLEHTYKMLSLENEAYITYMNKLDPEYCQSVLDQLSTKVSKSSSSMLSKASVISAAISQASLSSEGRKKRTMPTFMKIEILITIMEDSQEYFNKFVKRCSSLKHQYVAECEEAKTTGTEIANSLHNFQVSVVENGFDQLTQRIPAEKFLRFMDEWSKLAQFIIQKLLLHNNNEKILLNKLKINLTRKRDLGANVHAVDFDQLIIQNRNLKTKIGNTYKYVKELKKLNGSSNLVLTHYKNCLLQQQKDAVILKKTVADQKDYIDELNAECEDVTHQLEHEKDNYYSFKEMKDQFEVPPVIDYVEIKAKLYEKYKQLKMAERRKKILDIALNASVTQMKNLLKTNVIDSNWFRSKRHEDTDLDLNN